MGSSLLRRLVVVSMILVVPAVGYAQEAAVTGTVIDATMAVMPGVTIKAVHVASGNTFEAVTDQRGAYRLARARRRLQDHGGALRLQSRSLAKAWNCSSDRRPSSTCR